MHIYVPYGQPQKNKSRILPRATPRVELAGVWPSRDASDRKCTGACRDGHTALSRLLGWLCAMCISACWRPEGPRGSEGPKDGSPIWACMQGAVPGPPWQLSEDFFFPQNFPTCVPSLGLRDRIACRQAVQGCTPVSLRQAPRSPLRCPLSRTRATSVESHQKGLPSASDPAGMWAMPCVGGITGTPEPPCLPWWAASFRGGLFGVGERLNIAELAQAEGGLTSVRGSWRQGPGRRETEAKFGQSGERARCSL